ncbi:DCC1-like thiol-disulfide oxidoreductase family protein [Pseudomarimonas salicorniae]|uniref:DCC1-like thiol-disulfide oxidoreductase family protein n=1 Tax=Pseudomarimonas salicorniae TaxID=2933270 RepID=A0ABT0GLB7_9GAMM|nr:DCC1-like thiol-disulfide oxidoreductase family protein [Lysobacter sp. CAU 1642]MCK7595324.1 DCC1-like thiol-disulfide oxidoreductase family protein [Lysobacter sp. CAU 1642]
MTERWTGAQYSLYRALLGVYLIVHFGMLWPWAGEVFGAGGAVAAAQLSPYFGLLPNPLFVDDGALVLNTLFALGCASSLAVLVGWGDRAGALIAALVLGWLFQRNPLIANPSLPLFGWLLLLHAFVPSRPYGSLAGRLRGVRPQWRLPRHLFLAAWVILALSYSHSGWTKLSSPSWVEGETIRLVLENPLARDHALRSLVLATPPIVLQALTWAVLLIELLFAPLVLVPRLRPWLWAAMLGAQVGFLTFLNFADLTFPMLLVHLLTFDPAWLSRWSRRSRAVMLFDGDCAFCHATVRLATHEDAQQRLQFAPLSGSTARQLLGAGPRPFDGESIVVVDESGHQALKSRAVIAVLERLGGLWLIAAWALRSLPQGACDAAYDLVGRWRYRLGGRARSNRCELVPGEAWRLLS